jgi:stress response protein YsnF
MALQRIDDFYPNYREEIFAGDDIKGFDVYAGDSDEKVGSIYDALVDETGRFRYLVIDTDIWMFGKKVLLPIGSTRFDYGARRVYATGLRSKAQAEQLPAYDELETLDYDREEQVRGVYRGITATETASNLSLPASYDRSSYNYEMDRPLYETNEQNHQTLKLYEERLIANKNRAKTGEVAVGKRVETETARAGVPIEKERVIIERVTPIEAGQVVYVGESEIK